MALERKAASRRWAAQKGAQQQDTSGEGAHGRPVRVFFTSGATADCRQAVPLIEGFDVQCLLADTGYGSNEVIEKAIELGMETVMPPRRNRKKQRSYNKRLYRIRHLAENAFCILGWAGACHAVR